jgi:phytoene synthase
MIAGQGTAERTASLAAHYHYCGALLHDHDRDRWLANLFAPAEKRPHLNALYAFNIEIARIRDVVSDPMPGEIRMQWWSDALENEARGDVRAHPVADAFLDTVETCGLDRSAFAALIEARRFDLYDDPMPDRAALVAYCEASSSELFCAAAKVLSGEHEQDAGRSAGIAYALTGLMRALLTHAARGQCFLPADLLAQHGTSSAQVVARQDTPGLRETLAEICALARANLNQAQTAIALLAAPGRPAFLPLALVPLYLSAMERRDYAPFASQIQIPQWRRQWRLWRAARRN